MPDGKGLKARLEGPQRQVGRASEPAGKGLGASREGLGTSREGLGTSMDGSEMPAWKSLRARWEGPRSQHGKANVRAT